MTPPTGYTEDALIERPAIALLAELGWKTVNAYHEFDHGASSLGRETKDEVVLKPRLREALLNLNPEVSIEAIHQAIEELTRDRSRMSATAANREIYHLLKNGVRVPRPDPDGDGETVEVVRVVDWDDPAHNDFLLCSQFWVTGEMHTRRADLVGFVNGLPLLFIELKAAHRRLETAFTGNLRDYKDTVPQLFWPNVLIILSNGSQSRVGSVTAGWEHFAEWKKVSSEDEAQEKKLEREFAREYHLITRDERLEAVAKDLVTHFTGRGFQGKAMMVCIDKATAIRMYDKVKKHWAAMIAVLQAEWTGADGEARRALEERIARMKETDMAVVVSQGQNEIAELAEDLHTESVRAENNGCVPARL
jgi:type I site-specific restriction-modification system R (restriction) subunit